MNDAMEALYLHAQEYLSAVYLAQEKGYYVRVQREDEYEKRLRGLLDEPGQKLLDDLIQTKMNLSLANERAAFQCGIRVALELFR